MTVVHAPNRTHRCGPGEEIRRSTGTDGWSLPAGTSVVIPSSPYRYPKGTVWRCDDCGKTWVSQGSPALHMPGVCTWREEGRFERWRRERTVRRQEG